MSSLKISTDSIPLIDSTGSPESEKVPGDQVIATCYAPQPAVWVDLGEASLLTNAQQDEIQIMADLLIQKIIQSGLDPASPEYKQVWDQAVADSDQLFRQRYGDQAWLQHHLHAFHMAQSATAREPGNSLPGVR